MYVKFKRRKRPYKVTKGHAKLFKPILCQNGYILLPKDHINLFLCVNFFHLEFSYLKNIEASFRTFQTKKPHFIANNAQIQTKTFLWIIPAAMGFSFLRWLCMALYVWIHFVFPGTNLHSDFTLTCSLINISLLIILLFSIKYQDISKVNQAFWFITALLLHS